MREIVPHRNLTGFQPNRGALGERALPVGRLGEAALPRPRQARLLPLGTFWDARSHPEGFHVLHLGTFFFVKPHRSITSSDAYLYVICFLSL